MVLLSCIWTSDIKKKFSLSQRLATIKLIEKKVKIKDLSKIGTDFAIKR